MDEESEPAITEALNANQKAIAALLLSVRVTGWEGTSGSPSLLQKISQINEDMDESATLQLIIFMLWIVLFPLELSLYLR